MSTFSEESLLLIEHWTTVKDILKARDQLAKELAAMLLSLEPELKQMAWWNDTWRFERYRDSQVYISNENWRRGERHGIWIGVEKVEPEYVFGSDWVANLYVWVTGNNDGLLVEVVNRLQTTTAELPGEVDNRMGNYYAARRDVRSYLGGDVETYVAELKAQILEFFSAYATWLWGIDEVIRQHL